MRDCFEPKTEWHAANSSQHPRLAHKLIAYIACTDEAVESMLVGDADFSGYVALLASSVFLVMVGTFLEDSSSTIVFGDVDSVRCKLSNHG